MRVALSVAILFISTAAIHQVSAADDLYWEGEDESANEYLEVKDEYEGFAGSLKRIKRGWLDFFSPSSSTTEASNLAETTTADNSYQPDDDLDTDGSGSRDGGDTEVESKEKTLRVSFVVNQPYFKEYSDRDSAEFKRFSASLANAVNLLYDGLPGTQRASLVRIQSRVSDEFTCKVTLDILTTGYDDTDRIANILQTHINEKRNLGDVAVSDTGFSAVVADASSTIYECEIDEISCDGNCFPGSSRCDGNYDCNDGSDENDCPVTNWENQNQSETNQEEQETTPTWSSWGTGSTGFDSDSNTGFNTEQESTDEFTTTPAYETPEENTVCLPDEFLCDVTRCVSRKNLCDKYDDCTDRTDEMNCPAENCGFDDFRCLDGQKCIPINQRCDGLVDCTDQSDEKNCDCNDQQFQCERDKICIEFRKHCDGTRHCADGSDEVGCDPPEVQTIAPDVECGVGRVQCPQGSDVDCAVECNGIQECIDGSDEENCLAPECNQECDGRCLEDVKICDGNRDCSDGSDERDCASCDSPNDFSCKTTGQCIPASQVCNEIPECDDHSDEEDCNDKEGPTGQCREYEFLCGTGECVHINSRCNNNHDCKDGSDEVDCIPKACGRGEFTCDNGQCVARSAFCDGTYHCDDGSDERGCSTTSPNFTTPRPTSPPITTQRTDTRTWTYPPNINPTTQGSQVLKLLTRPEEQSVRNVNLGGDVVFRCRDEGSLRAPVRWMREYNRPIRSGSIEKRGRLEIYGVDSSDAGVYICQAYEHLSYPGSEKRVQLVVNTTQVSPVHHPCRQDQATCGNLQCVPKSALCDGKRDCSDGYDEENCVLFGRCDPNQFKCANNKCVLKTWVCDSENDCGDNSDEENCGPRMAAPGRCLDTEFRCRNGQCVPKYYLCDGQPDCIDRSDEVCVPHHVTKPPTPSLVVLKPGETLTLTCEVAGAPAPLISWRLNWGHVPESCSSTSHDGVGVLTCTNVQAEHRGAYSCEAIGLRDFVFATPDAIVDVQTSNVVCPSGFFNSEARRPSECIRCFCFGGTNQCSSADLFTYNMPTPFGSGGTRLVGVKQTPAGGVELDNQQVDQYDFQPFRNGATVTKMTLPSWPAYGSSAHPYLTLPETYNGNQLKSYGGHIRYQFSPDVARYGIDDTLPDIIIKGEFGTLAHTHPKQKSNNTYIDARLTPGNWKIFDQTGRWQPATREDIMMTLDSVKTILLRADLHNAGVTISDFVMESAGQLDSGKGAANLVEECRCPSGYEGLSCEKCSSGYVRRPNGAWLGSCVREHRECPAGTYGDPDNGVACKPCPCPLTSPSNQFATTCHINSYGSVVCDCPTGYRGERCEYCDEGYVGNPSIPGDSCRPRQTSQCVAAGTARSPMPDECVCKENVQGIYCEQCKDNSFFLSEDFRHGCASCFCSGVSQQCRSSNLRRKTTSAWFNTPALVQQVRVYSSAALGPSGNVKYNAPVETQLRPILSRGHLELSQTDTSRPSIYYWSLPNSFAGDKVTSYGGYLTYTLTNVARSNPNTRNTAADVQLISDNLFTFHYFGNFEATDGTLNVSLQFLEKGWQRADGIEVSREHFLLALADVKAILVKATYSTYAEVASLESASIETAEPGGFGPQALHVEQCVCPKEYKGTSCEDCAPGYTRNSDGHGIYLENCEPCSCNGHSSNCDPESGVCYDCRDNTAGDQCDTCKPGFQKNGRDECVPMYETTPGFPTDCRCDPRGEAGPCDRGYCSCKENVAGEYCDTCRPGTFGLSYDEPRGCISCYCSGLTNECHEAGHLSRLLLPAPMFGQDYGGFTLMTLDGNTEVSNQIVPDPFLSELTYSFSSSIQPVENLYWSLPSRMTGNQLFSYGGKLIFTQKFESEYEEYSNQGQDVVLIGERVSVYWTNPNLIQRGNASIIHVPLRENGWYLLSTGAPATRNDFMAVLKNLRRIQVRATLVSNIVSTSISDVSLDKAEPAALVNDPTAAVAKGIEICQCPEGYDGSSCETCSHTWYRDLYYKCLKCPCNGHSCKVDSFNTVICECSPPYTGPDCSTNGDLNNLTTLRPPLGEPSIMVQIYGTKIKLQEIGSSINLTCSAYSRLSSVPIPVRWAKVGGELPVGRTQIDTRSGSLLITDLQLSDSGQYVCQASDRYSTQEDLTTITFPTNAMSAPVVSVSSPSTEYYEGDRIELVCVASGNPAPSLTWQRSGNAPLPRTLYSQPIGGTFVIERATQSDTGEYRCIARNNVGARESVITINVRPAYPSLDRLIVSPSAPTINEGGSTRIMCSTTSANIPAGTIDWVRDDGVQFPTNIRSENGILHINLAVPGDRGIYTCKTTSPGVEPVSIMLTVVADRPLDPTQEPNVKTQEQIRIPTGGSGSVECYPSGYPRPSITWKKHEDNFGPGVHQQENSLVITNAQESDAGYYICEGLVETPSGVIDTKVSYLLVDIEKREAARVRIHPEEEQAVNIGSTFDLYCIVDGGFPEPTVMWSREGSRELSPYTEIQKNNKLRFGKVEVNDEGTYICTATNAAGSVSASAVIKVRSPPEITISPRDFLEISYGESTSIECRASGYPEPTVTIKNSRGETVAGPAERLVTLRVQQATERDEGEYTCTAVSASNTISEPIALRVIRGDMGFSEGGSGEEDFDQPDEQNPEQNQAENLTAPVGTDISLQCNAAAGTNVVWRRLDGQPLPTNARQSGTSLIIYKTSDSDSGQYVCNIYDGNTQEEIPANFKILQVLPAPPVMAPRMFLQPRNQTVHTGVTATITCKVDASNVNIEWRGYNRELSRRVENRGAVLIFREIQPEDAGLYECTASDGRFFASDIAEVLVDGSPEEQLPLVTIDQPRRQFREGETVTVLCRASSRDVNVNWERYNNEQQRVFVQSVRYGDGAMLQVNGVRETDAGVYRCTGSAPNRAASYEDFNLEVIPVTMRPPQMTAAGYNLYKARMGQNIDMPCTHNLEAPVSYEWRREHSPLPQHVRSDQPVMYLQRVTEADAGKYVCRVSNGRASVEGTAILRVEGILPHFDGDGWISLPTLKDAVSNFVFEITFNPADANGLLLYNSENQGRNGDYIALELVNGIPRFSIRTFSNNYIEVSGDRPLQLNTWHTIRVNKVTEKVTMDVDNTGPFVEKFDGSWQVLDLNQPLYVGGVPDFTQLPDTVQSRIGFVGCVSMLVHQKKNIIVDSREQHNINDCNTCAPNLCHNDGVCQEARNDHGYICLCTGGYGGLRCDRTGAACRPGVCGPGECIEIDDGYKCSCPMFYTGRNCETKNDRIEYPAFTGSGFLAINPPSARRSFIMSMKVKPAYPVKDGIIMYCAESDRGYGGFTSLAVHDGKLEFHYDLGDGSPVVLTADNELPAKEWTSVHINRVHSVVQMTINSMQNYKDYLKNNTLMNFETPLFVGGIDEYSIVPNRNVGVVGGFSGCINDVTVNNAKIDIINNRTKSSNVQECSTYERGDIPATESLCQSCRNEGYCASSDATECTCIGGFTGLYCENRPPLQANRPPRDPCATSPCHNGGTCRPYPSHGLPFTCDCPFRYGGSTCIMELQIKQDVGFNGTGYLELPSHLIRYDRLEREPASIAMAFRTTKDGVLLYQRERQDSDPSYGDYLLIHVNQGQVAMRWDMGSGTNNLVIENAHVNDGQYRRVLARFNGDNSVSLTLHAEAEYTKNQPTTGFSKLMNADSSIYIGGIPDQFNVQRLPGLSGCIDAVEFMDASRGLNLGDEAIGGINTQPCGK